MRSGSLPSLISHSAPLTSHLFPSQMMTEDQPPMKDVVKGVLTDLGLSSSRASKLDVDDFLVLLDAFNKAGVHFSS